MDNPPTEYCSFVSVDYIICECGDTFPNEDALRDHLETDHTTVKHEKPGSLFDNFIDKKDVKKELKQPLVIAEKLPEVDLESNTVFLFDLEEPSEYCVQEAAQSSAGQLEPANIKREEYVVQYVDGNEAYVVVKEEPEATDVSEEYPIGCKQVTFKREQIPDDVVILAQENEEHDYDREAEKTVTQEYYFCDVCGKSFVTEKAVRQHMRLHSLPTPSASNKKPKTAVCDVCGKKYAMWARACGGCGAKRPPSKAYYQALKARSDARFTCDVCGVGRSSNAALRYHQRVHTGERPYKCNMCDKTFTMPLFLQLHVRTHTGERPYSCPLCPKAFSNQAALVRHNRVHTGVKPYECPQCGKSFTQSNSMKLHFQTVHLRMPAPYKSAARRLRDNLKQQITGQESTRKPRKVWQPIKNIPCNKLIIQHRLYEQPKIEYIEESNTIIEGEDYTMYDESD